MAINRYRSASKSTKSSKRKDILPSAIRWVAFFLGAVYLGWALAFPQYSGVIGQGLSEFLFKRFGAASYLLPVFLFNGLLQHVLRGKSSGWMVTSIASLCGLLAGTALSAQVGGWMGLDALLSGGTWGAAIGGVLTSGMGAVGAFLLALGGFLFALQVCFEIRWSAVAQTFAKLLAEDSAEWTKARAEMKALKAKAPAQDEAAKSKSKAKDADLPKAKPAPESLPLPKAVDTREVKPLGSANGRPDGAPKLVVDKAAKVKAAHGRKKVALVVCSEAVDMGDSGKEKLDEFGHMILKERGVAERLTALIEKETGIETRSAVIGHIQRGGPPTLFDRILGTRVGVAAADLAAQGKFGQMVALRGNAVVPGSLDEATAKLKTVSPEWLALLDTLCPESRERRPAMAKAR